MYVFVGADMLTSYVVWWVFFRENVTFIPGGNSEVGSQFYVALFLKNRPTRLVNLKMFYCIIPQVISNLKLLA